MSVPERSPLHSFTGVSWSPESPTSAAPFKHYLHFAKTSQTQRTILFLETDQMLFIIKQMTNTLAPIVFMEF